MIVVPDAAAPWIRLQRTNFRNHGDAQAKHAYATDVLADFAQLEPHLPERVESILDIGCGLAGIDVLLKRRYPDAKLYLLDGDGDETRSGWNPDGDLGAFNSRAATEELLKVNGIVPDGWYNIGSSKHLKADLVISLASWGYHYPLSTYRVSGLCIADLRKSAEPARGTVIREYKKRNRCIWREA